MNQRNCAIVVFIVALLVVVVCGVSFVQAADIQTDVCGAAKGWAHNTDTGSSGSLLLDLAAIPVGSVESVAPVFPWAALPEIVGPVAGEVLAEPRAPRAPPIA